MQVIQDGVFVRADEGQGVIVVDAAPLGPHSLLQGLEAYGLNARICRLDEVCRLSPSDAAGAVVVGPHLTPLQVWDICREVRQTLDVSIIALLNADGPDYLSMALDAGADAAFVVGESVSPRLILSAMQAAQRREKLARRSASSIVEAGSLKIDLYRKTVELDGNPVPLTATEFGILAVLAQHPGRVISAAEIVKHVHGYDAGESDAQDIVKVHISRLRQKLETDSRQGSGIANVRGQGYMYLFERRSDSAALDQFSPLPADRRGLALAGTD